MAYILGGALAYASVRFFLHYNRERNLMHLMWCGAAFFYLLSLLFGMFASGLEHLNPDGWFRVTGISLVLTALGMENWQDRPAVARFPFVFTFVPLLLIATFILVYNTVYIKDVLLGIYEGGAILTALILFGLFTSKYFDYIYPLVGIGLLLLAFVIFWFPGEVVAGNIWIRKLILAAGCVTFTYGYFYAFRERRLIEEEHADGIPA